MTGANLVQNLDILKLKHDNANKAMLKVNKIMVLLGFPFNSLYDHLHFFKCENPTITVVRNF